MLSQTDSPHSVSSSLCTIDQMSSALVFPVIVVLCLLPVSFTAESELICSQQPIVALAGDDVILPCHLEPPISASSETVVWTRTDLDPKYIHVHKDGRPVHENQNPFYSFRTRLFVDQLISGNVSMKLFKVKTSDTGNYTCILPSMLKEASLQLSVGDPDVIGSPEPVKVAVGHDAILPCRLDPAFDVTTLAVEWRRNGTNVHSYGNRSDYLGDQDENFRGRTSLFHDEMTKGNISLKLTNVTELDAGSYTCCLSKLHCQRKRGNITLTVDTEKLHNEAAHSHIWTVVAVLCVVAVLLLIAAFICWRYKILKKCGNSKREGNLQMSDQNTANGSGTREPFLQSAVVEDESSSTIEQLDNKAS